MDLLWSESGNTAELVWCRGGRRAVIGWTWCGVDAGTRPVLEQCGDRLERSWCGDGVVWRAARAGRAGAVSERCLQTWRGHAAALERRWSRASGARVETSW